MSYEPTTGSPFSWKQMVKKKKFISLISDCIENRKIVKLYLKWCTGETENYFFEPYLLGDNPNDLGLFVYGKNLEKGNKTSYDRLHITFIELTDFKYPIKDQIRGFYPSRNIIIKSIPEIKMLDKPPALDFKQISDDEDDEVKLEHTKPPCIICGSKGSCEHLVFLNNLFKKQQSLKEEEKKYTQLLKEIIEHHPRFYVFPYFVKDEKQSKIFSRIKRKKWTEYYFTLIGEWSQSPMHSGDLTFILKSTQDKKHWAFFLEGHPTRIYAVAEILDEGNVVMEKVAAGMMSVYTEHEGVYIECFDTIGEVDLTLLYDLYNHYNEKNRQIDKPPEG